MKELVERLRKAKKQIATMESCTGGAIASSITDVEGSSEILKFSAVTYSNEYKIKMGVPREVIDTYSVYSMETAREMSRQITFFSNSDYGVGITGKLNRVDPDNPYGEDNIVFISVYEKETDTYSTSEIKVLDNTRHNNKKLVLEEVKKILNKVIK